MEPVSLTNPKIQVITVASFDALEPYTKQWDQLALQAPQQLPMLSSAWVLAYLQHCLNPDEKWRCYLATAPDGCLIGILPIIIKPHPLWRSFLPTLHTPWDWHTRSGDLLTESGMENCVLHAFWDTLHNEFGNYFVLEIKGIRDNSPTLSLLNSEAPIGVSWIRREEPLGGFIAVQGSFEAFQGKFTDKVNRNLHRQGKRLAEMPDYCLTFYSGPWTDFSQIEKFFKLEALGWKGNEKTAIACSIKLQAFYRQLAHNLANRGWLELDLLEVEGKLIACHFAVHFGAALVILKTAYDEAYAKFSSGSVLFEKTVERAFKEAGCYEINLLSDANWLNRWKVEWGRYWQLDLFPRHPVVIILEKVPRVLQKKLIKIQWLRHLYQRLTNLF